MKPTPVFALLVLFLYTVCGDLAETSAVRSLSQSRRLQEVVGVSGAGDAQAGGEDSEACIPIPYIDFDYKRTPIKDNHVRTITVSGPTECLNKCLERLECLALNYNPNTDTDNCELLKTVQGVSIEDESQTVLLRFSHDNPCHPDNFVNKYHRTGSDYKPPPGYKPGDGTDPAVEASYKAKDAEDCCEKCHAETRCVAWDYDKNSQVCYRKGAIRVLKTQINKQDLVTGPGGYCKGTSQSSFCDEKEVPSPTVEPDLAT